MRDVLRTIRIAAENHQWPVTLDLLVGADDQFGIILRLQPAHIKKVALLWQAGAEAVGRDIRNLRTIGDQSGILMIVLTIILLDYFGIRHNTGWRKDGQDLTKM